MILKLKNGLKIHIKKSRRGSFTKWCGGNVTEECIRRGKNSPDPRIRKKATFAANARSWSKKHQNGGILLPFVHKYYDGGSTEFDDNMYGPAVPTHTYYNIKTGDTLTKIAQQNNISLDQLLKLNPEIKDFNKIKVGQRIKIPFSLPQKNTSTVKSINDDNYYIIKSGDTLTKIARDNNITLKQILENNSWLNGSINTIIHVGDKVKLPTSNRTVYTNINEVRDKEKELNASNLDAIKNANHKGNYIVVDKPNRNLIVYNQNGEPLYSSKNISFGSSGDDYNTITYTGGGRNIINGAGNNSTPAGITVISGIGTYHGYPSFTRSRVDDYGNMKTTPDGNPDNVASSFHFGNTDIKCNSNGCVRMNGKTLKDLQKYATQGTMVYTIPEKEGSRFVLKDGNLSFVADNPYGETEGPKRNWDDYNVNVNKTYQPIKIELPDYDNNDRRQNNAQSYAMELERNKEKIMQDFNLDSSTYNSLVQLAMGIADQESKFGTSKKYMLKQVIGPEGITLLKRLKNGANTFKESFTQNSDSMNKAGSFLSKLPTATSNAIASIIDKKFNPAVSRGYSQIKMLADPEKLRDLYSKYNIDLDNISASPNESAIATMLRLAYMYNNEVKGRNFTDANGEAIDPMTALLYKWSGHNSELKNNTATPEKNKYVKNVNDYANDFVYYIPTNLI